MVLRSVPIGQRAGARSERGRRPTRHAGLRIGLHRDVEVTEAAGPGRPTVSQAFCSALPVSYATPRIAAGRWEGFARMVLEAAYEATLLAGVLGSPGRRIVALTRLGGGAFGNDDAWIDDAIGRALQALAGRDLDVRIVTLGEPSPALRRLERAFPVPVRA